jgi:cation-transporting ATPase E
MPFSSARKWSGASFDGHGDWVLGAPDVLLLPGAQRAEAEQLGAHGRRVLLLGRAEHVVDAAGGPGYVEPVALVVLEQKIRDDAKATLDYFAQQGVHVKVISGDNAVSVGAVAEKLGLPSAESPVDARELPEDADRLAEELEEHAVFGRVSPAQKRAMVRALQSQGHTVAMTGDGVNDVLALKDADIGVSMGAGSPATRAVAQIVLLDNKFATLPLVVAEGRRVIGNIERVSNLFLTKTVYSVILALMVGLAQVPYPFLPRHVTITAWFTIGLPAFVLSLAPNNERARTGFVGRVLRMAVPAGVVIATATFASYLLVYKGSAATELDKTQSGTTALITLITVAMWVLGIVARPYALWKIGLIGGMIVLTVLLFIIPFTQNFFALDPTVASYTLIAFACAAVGIAVIELA